CGNVEGAWCRVGLPGVVGEQITEMRPYRSGYGDHGVVLPHQIAYRLCRLATAGDDTGDAGAHIPPVVTGIILPHTIRGIVEFPGEQADGRAAQMQGSLLRRTDAEEDH